MTGMLDSFRKQHPAYKDVPDDQLAEGLYRKFYAGKMSRADFDAKVGPAAEPDGITGPVSAIKNIGQGFNRGLGRLASGADYAMLGFLDDTPEGQAKRPLGYLAQVLKGEQDIPGTGKRFAHEPTTPGERMLQRGGEVLGESIGPAAVMAAPARMLGSAARPATGTMERALKTLSEAQAGMVAPEATALSKLADRGASAATKKILGDTVGGAVSRGTGAVRNAAREAKQAVLLGGETAGAIGSGIGEEIGREATPDSAVGPVVGALAGGLAPAAAALPVVRNAANKVAGFADTVLSQRASANRARNFVADHLGQHLEGDATQARLRRAEELRGEIEGFDPDLAAASGSEALKETKAAIFGKASGADLENLRAREAATEKAVRDFANRQAPEGQADADAVFAPLLRERDAAADQMRALEQQKSQLPAVKRDQAFDVREKAQQQLGVLDEQERSLPAARDIADTERLALEELTARTNGARSDIVGRVQRVDRSAEGAKIRDSIKAERSRRMDEINQMSKDLGIDGLQLTTPFRSFARSVKDWRGDLLPSQSKNMPDAVQDIEALRGKTSVSFNDIKALRESMVDEVLEATRDTSPGHRKRLANAVRLRSMLDEQVLGFDTLEGGIPGSADLIERATHYADSPDFGAILQSAQMSGGGKKPFKSLSDFIVDRGGIRESRGELKARDIGARSRPGLFRKNGGLRHDDAALAAWEAGYFPGKATRPTPDELLNALDDDLNGRYRFREEDQAAVDALNAHSDTADDFVSAMEDLGISWQNASVDEIRARLAESGQEPVDLGAAAQNWQDFRRAYFEKIIEPFERGQVKKTTSKDGSGFYRTLDEEVALGYLDSADAAEQISRIAKTQPELMASLEAVGLDDLAAKTVANGVINPRALERWAESRRGALEHLPSLRRQVNDLVAAVADVETRFAKGKKIIRDRKIAEQRRLADQRARIGQERKAIRQGAAEDVRQITKRAADEQSRIDDAMNPLLERMGVHNERKMAAEDAQLAKRLKEISAGGSTPLRVIDDALKKPKLMRRLWTATEKHLDARKALQRHLWDDLTVLGGAELKGFLQDNAKSLSIAFGPKHIKQLKMIGDALEMIESAAVAGRAKPISTDLVDIMKRTTGLNPSAMAGSYTGVARGRSSRTVEFFNNFYRWMNERTRQGVEKTLRTALFEPGMAESLIQSAQNKVPKAGDSAIEKFATKRLRGWLWRLGIVAPIDERERSGA